MKEKIVEKMEEHIQRILDKPEITGEEYMTLRCRLDDIRMAEERARQALQSDHSHKLMVDMMQAIAANAEVGYNGM